jgi:hypothetical protein
MLIVIDLPVTHRGHQQGRTERATDRIVTNRTVEATSPATYTASQGTRVAKPTIAIPDARMSDAWRPRMDVFSSASSPSDMHGRPRSLSSSDRQHPRQTSYTFQTYSNSLDPVRDPDSESLFTSCVDPNEVAKSSRSAHSTSQPSSPQSHWSLSSLDSSLHSVFGDRTYGDASNNENSASPPPESKSPTCSSFSMNLTDGSHVSFASNSEVESSGRIKKTKMHQCDICQKWFPRPSGLATHMNSHSGAKRKILTVDSS